MGWRDDPDFVAFIKRQGYASNENDNEQPFAPFLYETWKAGKEQLERELNHVQSGADDATRSATYYRTLWETECERRENIESENNAINKKAKKLEEKLNDTSANLAAALARIKDIKQERDQIHETVHQLRVRVEQAERDLDDHRNRLQRKVKENHDLLAWVKRAEMQANIREQERDACYEEAQYEKARAEQAELLIETQKPKDTGRYDGNIGRLVMLAKALVDTEPGEWTVEVNGQIFNDLDAAFADATELAQKSKWGDPTFKFAPVDGGYVHKDDTPKTVGPDGRTDAEWNRYMADKLDAERKARRIAEARAEEAERRLSDGWEALHVAGEVDPGRSIGEAIDILADQRDRLAKPLHKCAAVASDIRFAIRDDAHTNPKFAEGHKRILELCAERLEAFTSEPPPTGERERVKPWGEIRTPEDQPKYRAATMPPPTPCPKCGETVTIPLELAPQNEDRTRPPPYYHTQHVENLHKPWYGVLEPWNSYSCKTEEEAIAECWEHYDANKKDGTE